jgi:hypothetical protein
MPEQFPGLVVAYIGPNAAHRSLRAALANAKALTFVLVQRNLAVLRDFLTEAEKAKQQSRDGEFAVVMVGDGSTTTTVHVPIHLTGTEIALIDAELGGFVPKRSALSIVKSIASLRRTLSTSLKRLRLATFACYSVRR